MYSVHPSSLIKRENEIIPSNRVCVSEVEMKLTGLNDTFPALKKPRYKVLNISLAPLLYS